MIVPVEPPPAHLTLAEAVMDAITDHLGPTTYARVDVVGADGQARVLEVELVEPSLFLSSATDATGRLVASLQRRLGSPSRRLQSVPRR